MSAPRGLAQTTPADPSAPQQSDPSMQADPAMTRQGADPAQAPQTADVSDAEVDQFAGAAVEVQKIGSDTAVAEDAKQEKMAAAVQSSGLSAERFNQIAQIGRAHV